MVLDCFDLWSKGERDVQVDISFTLVVSFVDVGGGLAPTTTKQLKYFTLFPSTTFLVDILKSLFIWLHRQTRRLLFIVIYSRKVVLGFLKIHFVFVVVGA